MTTVKGSRRDRRHRAERVAADLAAGSLAVAAFGSSLRHVQTVADHHGQSGWISWVIAATVELVSLVAISELSRARAKGDRVPPAAVLALGAGLIMSAAANAATARGAGGWPIVMALWPVVAYALVVLIVETRPGRSLAGLAESVTASTPARQHAPSPQPEPAVVTPAITSQQTAPASSTVLGTTETADRDETVAWLVKSGRALEVTWRDVQEATGMSKSWCEKRLAEARAQVRTPHLVPAAR